MNVIGCLVAPLIGLGMAAAWVIWLAAPKILSFLNKISPRLPQLAAAGAIGILVVVAVTNIHVVPCHGKQTAAGAQPFRLACNCFLR